MNDKMNNSSTKDAPRDCERTAELVTYMYGEATPAEAGLFRQHLATCAVCEHEMIAFGDVRQAVGGWRMEALSQLPALSLDHALAPAAHINEPTERKRSALAAIREFFSLSPLWLQAGAVAATLILCALAALTVARTEIRWDGNGLAYRSGTQERIVKERVEAPMPNTYTQAQVDALVDEKLSQRMEVARAEWQQEQAQKAQVIDTSASNTSRKTVAPRYVLAVNAPRTSNRQMPASNGAGSRNNMYQVAENDSLPRLTDLLGAVNENNK